MKYGLQRTYDLLYAEDGNGHNAMYWAAHSGDVNIIEYLIRRNLDPTLPDAVGTTPLHVSADKGNFDAIIFFIKCGCNPFLRDRNGETAVSLARKSVDSSMLSAIKVESRARKKSNPFCLCMKKCCSKKFLGRTRCRSSSLLVGIEGGMHLRCANQEEEKYVDLEDGTCTNNPIKIKIKKSRSDMGDPIVSPGFYRSGVSLHKGKENKCIPHALRRLKPSRFSYCCLYSFILIAYWVLSLAIPYYAWIATVLGSVYLFRFVAFQILDFRFKILDFGFFILFFFTTKESKKMFW